MLSYAGTYDFCSKKKDINDNNNPSFSFSLLCFFCLRLVDNGKFFLTLRTTHIENHTYINITEDEIVEHFTILNKKSRVVPYSKASWSFLLWSKVKRLSVLIVLTSKCPSLLLQIPNRLLGQAANFSDIWMKGIKSQSETWVNYFQPFSWPYWETMYRNFLSQLVANSLVVWFGSIIVE